MPTYEYRCVDCGNRIEVFQRIGDDPLTVCDVCGGSLRKVFHPAGIVFKGSGFYATDSRSRSGDGKRSGSTGDGKGSDAKKGDAKPASTGDKAGSSPAKEGAS